MGLNASPESSGGIWSAIKGSLGLFSDQNKAGGVGEEQNPIPQDEFESSMDEKEILELTREWKKFYSVYYDPIEKGQKMSFDYWVGKHRDPYANTPYQVATGSRENTNVIDNLIFKAIETFLPVATRANPEPLVQADPSDVGQSLANDIKVALAHEADTQLLRRKLARATRDWLLYRIGVVKVSWNFITKKIETTVINPKRMIFDRDGHVDEKGFFVGEYLGEKKRQSVEEIIQMFCYKVAPDETRYLAKPLLKEQLMKKAGGKKGTMLTYVEWWYRGKDNFFVLDELVLGKYKNHNWNYDIEAKEGKDEIIDEETGELVSPAEEVVDAVEAVNHLDEPSAPYRFLSIFNTGEQPHDNTSLILQNLPQQDKINRREVQIDQYIQGLNGGVVVSGSAFTEEQAAQAASARRRGVAIRVPNGDVTKAIMYPQVPEMPASIFDTLKDARQELEGVFGTSGLTSEGVQQEDTVRGKIMVNQADSSRIGGGITEYIEQLADSIYNLWVQMMFVYYDEPHYIASAGAVSGMELVELTNAKFPLLKTLTVTVKEGSLIPKDPLTQRNEAIDLWSANAIDPLTLFKKLDVPNPQEATNQLILWQMLQKGQIQPQMYLEGFAIAGQTPGQNPQGGLPPQGQPTQPGTGGPAVSPPTGQGQTPPTQEPLGSQGAVAAQSKSLLGAVPAK
jgi:hypothetical protein